MRGVRYDTQALWLLRGGNCLPRSVIKFLPNFIEERKISEKVLGTGVDGTGNAYKVWSENLD